MIVSGIVLAVVLTLALYFWLGDRKEAQEMTEGDQSLSAISGGSVQSTNVASQGADTEGETIETIMIEIEAQAAGDDTAMEDELAGESESFMEGAVVMEQLGQGYDETSY